MENSTNSLQKSRESFAHEIELKLLLRSYSVERQALLQQIAHIITPELETIANTFYQEMLSIPKAALFLNNSLVNKRLYKSMVEWLRVLFTSHNAEEVKQHIKRQGEIGNVHARINIPIHLINHGIRLIKHECWELLARSTLDKFEMLTAIKMVDELLDYSVALMNESYVNNVIINERTEQSLRMHSVNQGLAVECEHLRSLLFDWLRKVLITLYQDNHLAQPTYLSIYTSEFGLWVIYKADLLFADHQEVVEKLKEQIDKIDASTNHLFSLQSTGNKVDLIESINELNGYVTHAGWLLSTFVEHALQMEGGRDTLTRLFNRRYLTTIMQRAIRIGLGNNIPLAVLILDIDYFKQINDGYGHDSGDSVLVQFGELLVTHVRAGDFVFRYGGEEFLVLLNGVTKEIAVEIAEKLRLLVSQKEFIVDQTKRTCITTSVGIAIFEGHPDYSVLITAADKALYEAKRNGRNRCVLAEMNVI